MIRESSAYKFAGFLLLLTGLSHMSQIFLYEPTTVVRIASAFGVLYSLLGVLSLRRVNWLPGVVVAVCTFGFIAGTKRLIEGPFNIQFAAHQLIHIAIIVMFVRVILQRRKQNQAAPEDAG